MTYLSNFAHDVFISYAHTDDIPRWEKEDGWVTNFRDALVRQLPGYLARSDDLDIQKLDIWKDSRTIRGADFYDDRIKRAIRGSAVMISVMSRNYFESTYCLQELKTFCDHGDIAVEFEDGKKSRVIKLILSDISKHKLDQRISRTDGFKFFTIDKDGNERKFMRTLEGTPDDGYWITMEQLAGQVGKVLTRMAGRKPTAPVSPTGLSVYLAEVTDDLEDVRADIKEALTQQGIQVLPELRLPSQSRSMKKEIARNLERSVLSVHLMGPLPGKAADGDDLPTTQIQYRLASGIGVRSKAGNKLQRVVWLSPELDIAALKSDTQRTFLESLRYEQESESPMEMIQKNVEDLKAEILKKILPPPEKPKKFETKRRALVYVAHRPEDGDHAETIMNHLLKADQDVMLMQGNDEKEQMEDLRVRMKSCNAVLILYGRPPAKWARDVTLKARDMAEKRRRNPLFAKSVCDGPPDPKDKLGFYSKDWPILECRSGIEVEHLEPFIRAIALES
jgi:hypothetical protein